MRSTSLRRAVLQRLFPVAVLLAPLAFGGSAFAQPIPPPPPPPEIPPPPPPALPQNATEADRRAADLDQKIRILQQANEDMRKQMDHLQKQQDAMRLTPPTLAVDPHAKPAEPMVAGATTVLGLPLKFSGALSIRYDYWHNSDLTDVLTSNTVNNGFRQRIRFGVEFADPKTAMVIGGLRLSTGEVTNPTVPFIALGDSFRASAFGMDQAWFSVRPFENRQRLQLFFGRMPNQTWRGTSGTLRTEMLWDDDINPQGIAAKVLIADVPEALMLRVENLIAYYQVQENQDQRFVGLTGTTGLFQEQLKIASRFVDAAFSFYDWENLNNGLSSPAIGVGAVSVQTPTNANLFTTGLNNGNSRFAYGPMQAIGFVKDHFRIINPTVQVHLPFNIPQLGTPDIYLLGDYAFNFSANNDHRNGEGVTLGARLGDYTPESIMNPLNVWFTYRDVKSDVTVAALADSDLGVGTDYKGIEAGVSYRITKHLWPAVSYFDYYGFPLRENHAERLFLDLTGDF